jgi:hypothetical protein
VYEATRDGASWQQLLQPGQTLGVHCLHFYNNSNVTNSQLVARRVRDAVCDAVRDARCAFETQAAGAAAASQGGDQQGKRAAVAAAAAAATAIAAAGYATAGKERILLQRSFR